MTLKEKLNDSIITNINIVESENRMCYEYNHLELSEKCEKVAEEFAIGFLNWYAMHGSWIEENLTSKELLEIYKKEQANKCEYCGLENGNHKLSCPVIKVTIII